MGAGEGEGRRRPGGPRAPPAALGVGQDRPGRPDEAGRGSGRDRGPVGLGGPGTFHRPLDPALQLDGLQAGAEQPGRGSLEDPFEEPFEIGKRRIARGTLPEAAGTARPRDQRRRRAVPRDGAVLGGSAYTLAPSGWRRAFRPVSPGGTDDRDPHRVVLRTVRHPLHLRVGALRASRGSGASSVVSQGPEELRHVGRDVALRGDGRRPQRGRSARATAHQLDAFHKTFNFCMTCRQYTCGNCWNEAEGRCLTCAPIPGMEHPGSGRGRAGRPSPTAALEALAEEVLAGPEAWPEADLGRGPPGAGAGRRGRGRGRRRGRRRRGGQCCRDRRGSGAIARSGGSQPGRAWRMRSPSTRPPSASGSGAQPEAASPGRGRPIRNPVATSNPPPPTSLRPPPPVRSLSRASRRPVGSRGPSRSPPSGAGARARRAEPEAEPVAAEAEPEPEPVGRRPGRVTSCRSPRWPVAAGPRCSHPSRGAPPPLWRFPRTRRRRTRGSPWPRTSPVPPGPPVACRPAVGPTAAAQAGARDPRRATARPAGRRRRAVGRICTGGSRWRASPGRAGCGRPGHAPAVRQLRPVAVGERPILPPLRHPPGLTDPDPASAPPGEAGPPRDRAPARAPGSTPHRRAAG